MSAKLQVFPIEVYTSLACFQKQSTAKKFELVGMSLDTSVADVLKEWKKRNFRSQDEASEKQLQAKMLNPMMRTSF